MVERSLRRWLRHLGTGALALRRRFPPHALDAIAAAIKACESQHAGEIRFAIECALEPRELWAGISPRERAAEVFARLGVGKTAQRNGVLIYLLLADRDVEILADEGVAGDRVPAHAWEHCCQVMETQFRAGRFREGAVAGIQAVAAVLAEHAPPGAADAGNELPDRPAILL